MDLDKKKKSHSFESQSSFLADRCFIPGEQYNSNYVTAMLPPQEIAEDFYCQINGSERSCQQSDCYYEYVDSIDPGVDVDDLFDQSLGFVCEEILLVKSAEEIFGLTLFYCQNYCDPSLSDVFVGEIEPNSAASRCCGIHLGDQVLQINQQEVCTRDRVISLFAESTTHIHLLVARPASEQLKLMAETAVPRSPSAPYGMAHMREVLHSHSALEVACPWPQTHPPLAARDADSGMGRLEDSSDCSSFHSQYGASSLDTNIPPLPDDVVDLDVSEINDELSKLRWQCVFLEQEKTRREAALRYGQDSGSKLVPRMGTRVIPRPGQSVLSAVTRGDGHQPSRLSFISPAECDLSYHHGLLRLAEDSSDHILAPQAPPVCLKERLSSDHIPAPQAPPVCLKERLYSDYIPAPQAPPVCLKERFSSDHISAPQAPPYTDAETLQDELGQMKWVMKKRSDGSRYIGKRPLRLEPARGPEADRSVRGQIFEERARQTLSTDEDSTGEPRLGRCWSRAERKWHFERYREYRKQREVGQGLPQTPGDTATSNQDEVRVMLTFL